MFITDLLRGLREDVGRGIRPRRRPGRGRPWRGNESRGYSRALGLEGLEDRTMLTGFVVNTIVDDPSAGADVTDDFVSLREAITAANTNLPFGDAPAGEGGGVVDMITFDPSLNGKTITLDSRQLEISGDLSIVGPGADLLTISGATYSRVFMIWESSVTADLSGLTIANGNNSFGGGGIYNRGTLTLTDVALLENNGGAVGGRYFGGAIFNSGSATLTITGSTISGNSTPSQGGGIYAYGALTITDSMISDNQASGGGGVFSYGTLTITDCTLSGNQGGGIINGGTATVTACTFSGNSAGWAGCPARFGGGGIFNSDFHGTLIVADCTLSGNSAFGGGGGISHTYPTRPNSAANGSLVITNCTITGNRADVDGNGIGTGGGVFNVPSNERISTSLHNSLVAGNVTRAVGSTDESPDDISTDSAEHLTGTYNLIGDAATSGGLTDGVDGNIVGNAGAGTIDIATVLDPNLGDNGGPTLTHALVPGSLALDAGDNSKAVDGDGNPLAYDQRGEGFERVVNGTVDIGAFEVQPEYRLVQIDVKPGSEDNPLNLAGNGVIAVAILTMEDFDASRVDASTVVFAGATAVQSALEDVDGDVDMVLHFRVADTNLAEIYALLLAEDADQDGVLDSNGQAATVSLIGETVDGEKVIGTDEVDLFFSGKALRELLDELASAGLL